MDTEPYSKSVDYRPCNMLTGALRSAVEAYAETHELTGHRATVSIEERLPGGFVKSPRGLPLSALDRVCSFDNEEGVRGVYVRWADGTEGRRPERVSIQSDYAGFSLNLVGDRTEDLESGFALFESRLGWVRRPLFGPLEVPGNTGAFLKRFLGEEVELRTQRQKLSSPIDPAERIEHVKGRYSIKVAVIGGLFLLAATGIAAYFKKGP